jgi:glycerol-1-phosphate dehydrogenase [NAD(P)+]
LQNRLGKSYYDLPLCSGLIDLASMTAREMFAQLSAAALKLDDPLTALLNGTYVDPQDGVPVGVATRSLVIEDSLGGMEADLIAKLDLGRTLAVISDETTHHILGNRVENSLAGNHVVQSLVLPASANADGATVEQLRSASLDVDGYIAVGSGTISDLTKYVSAQAGRPYAVFGTAPSMNGYVSLTASITMHGHKMTLPAQAPVGAFFDVGVLAAAPLRMIRAGLGDSICRTTAQADWLLSHLLIGTPYRSLPFALLKQDESVLLDQAAALVRGDRNAIRTLIRTLTLSGFGTAIVGSSAPASQAEHLVSHYIDMMGDPNRPAVFHGEQVGVTTLSIARLQHKMLAARPVVTADRESEAELRARYGDGLSGSVIEEYAAKRIDKTRADHLNDLLGTQWDTIRETIAAVLLPVARLEAVLAAADAPMMPADIHLNRPFYETALLHAREIRNRFTALDLAAASGRLEPMLNSI